MIDMIYLFSGTPGSGKSLHMARIIYHRLAAHKPVIANFEVRVDKIKQRFPWDKELSRPFSYIDNSIFENGPEPLYNFSQGYFYNADRPKEGEILLFLDEAQILFNARMWNAKGRQAWIKFFTQHRKLGYDIYIVAQFAEMLDKQLRCLIEYEYQHRKVKNMGISGKLLSLLAFGNLFCQVQYWYPQGQRLGASFFRYHSRYADLYDTYALFEAKGGTG